MVFARELPGVISIAPDAGAMLKPGALTSRAREVVAVTLPELPVMVTRYDPRTAELLTVSVSTLLPVVGFVPKDAVTSLGRPEAERLTLPVNPPTSRTVMVVVPEAPGLIIKLLGEVESWKPTDTGGARASIKSCPVGLPYPVTRS